MLDETIKENEEYFNDITKNEAIFIDRMYETCFEYDHAIKWFVSGDHFCSIGFGNFLDYFKVELKEIFEMRYDIFVESDWLGIYFKIGKHYFSGEKLNQILYYCLKWIPTRSLNIRTFLGTKKGVSYDSTLLLLNIGKIWIFLTPIEELENEKIEEEG